MNLVTVLYLRGTNTNSICKLWGVGVPDMKRTHDWTDTDDCHSTFGLKSNTLTIIKKSQTKSGQGK